MAIFRRTTTTRERLKAIFSRADYTLMEAKSYFTSMHPDPMVTTIIDTEVIGGMVRFIDKDLGMASYICQDVFSMGISNSNCTISYKTNQMAKDIVVKIWNVNSNFITIELRCGNDCVSSIEQCPIIEWRQQTVKIIMDCLSEVIFSQYQIRYRNVRKGLF